VPPTGPNTPDQLDLVQQMNKLLQDQNKILQQIAGTMGAQAQASQQVSESNDKIADSAKNAADKTSELTEAMKQNTGGSEGLSAAMGKQADASNSASGSLDKFSKSAGGTVAVMGALSAAGSGLASAFAATEGAINLFGGGISSAVGIMKGALGVVGGFFSGLMSAAAEYANAGAAEMHAANEGMRKEFGDITKDQGAFIKGMAADLGSAQSALAASGTSLRGTIGRSAAVLQEMTAIAGEFGDSLVRMQDQIGGATSEMLLMRKGMNMSTETFKNMASTAEANGSTMQEALTETMVASAHLSKTFGVDVKVIGKNIDKMGKDLGSFGSMAPKELAAVATYATKLGVSIEALKGTMDAFDTFEGAAQNAGKLAEAFGMNVDAMAMMNAENPAERMDMLRQAFEETGKSVGDLSRHELKLMSESMGGIPIDELKNSLSISSDELGFGDFEDAAEEAAQKITPEEAMKDVADSMDRLATKLDQLAGGPLANFIKGFMQVLNRSPEFREILTMVGKWLKEFMKLGKAVGHMFVNNFLQPGNQIVEMLKGIFDLKRIQKFTKTVGAAFGEFFKLVKTDPRKAVENLFDSVFGAFKEWFAGGPAGTNMAEMLGGMIETGFLILAGLAPKIIKAAAGYIKQFATALGDFLNGDNAVANEIGGGIGGAFMEAFTAIKDSLINDLGPALLDLFGVLFAKFGPPLMAVLSVVWTAIFVKSVVSAAIAAAAGATLQAGIKFLGGKIMDMMSESSGGGGNAKDSKKAAAITKGIAEGFGDMLEAFRKIKDSDIEKAGKILWSMAKHMLKGMIAMAVGMVIVSAIISVVPFMTLIKGIIGLTAAISNTILMIGAVYAADKVSGGKYMKLGTSMLKLAVLFTVGGVAMAGAAFIFAAAWSMVNIPSLLMGVFALNALIVGVLPMLIMAGILGQFMDKLLPLAGPGFIGLAVVMLIAAAMALPAFLFGFAWSKVDIAGLLKGVFALNTLVIGILPFLVIGAALGVLLGSPVGVAAGLGIVLLGALMWALGYFAEDVAASINSFADKIGGTVNIGNFTKSVSVLSAMALVIPAIVAAGAVMFALGPGLVLAVLGLNNMKVFLWGAAPMLADAVKSLTSISIGDPKKTSAIMDVMGKVIGAVAILAEVGMKALKMSMAASLPFFGGGDPAKMMGTMSKFINDILGGGEAGGGIVGAVEKMVDMAGKFSPEALKGAEAISGIISAIAQLAGALIEPLTALSENSGDFWGRGKAADMESMITSVGSGVGAILSAMKVHLVGPEGIIMSLMTVFNEPGLKGVPMETLKARAETIKVLFDAILAIVTAVGKFQEFEKEGGFFSGDAKSAEKVIKDMLVSAKNVIASQALKNVILESVKLTEIITGDTEVIKAGAGATKDIVTGVSGIIMELAKLGSFLGEKGMSGLMALDTSLALMQTQGITPSMLIGKIVEEAKAIALSLGNMEADLGTVSLKPQLDAILGYDGEHKITIAPEAVNLNIRLQVAMDAEDLATAIVKSTKTKYGGFFKTTQQVNDSDLDLTAD